MLNQDKSCFENSVDPDQLASKNRVISWKIMQDMYLIYSHGILMLK